MFCSPSVLIGCITLHRKASCRLLDWLDLFWIKYKLIHLNYLFLSLNFLSTRTVTILPDRQTSKNVCSLRRHVKNTKTEDSKVEIQRINHSLTHITAKSVALLICMSVSGFFFFVHPQEDFFLKYSWELIIIRNSN